MIGPEYPTLASFYEAQVAAFPEHRGYLERRFRDDDAADLEFCEALTKTIAPIVGDNLQGYVEDYRWLAEIVIEEEIAFRRTGRYRLSTFEEANREVYANREYMTRYMNGLLMSQLWWRNHTQVMRYFRDTYLPTVPAGGKHLEIGPGHGLFLYYAAEYSKAGSVSGWDISETSLDLVRHTFRSVGLGRPVDLDLVDMFSGPENTFDSVTFSEVLEHMEEAAPALEAIFRVLKPGGRAFINAPVNSPAPDHLILFKTPEEVVDHVRAAGFEIEGTLFSPTSGASLERARKMGLAISTAVIGIKPELKA
ncbi:MAG: methyltransferase domain-containing protein [Caulobacteraceae bacterium]|nr:methyltransferase domain-containing protein [Caulobacter sp.]RYF91945.1 MAG: methyltransferase domain-containing protein [Caulobacteraceae bacterium]